MWQEATLQITCVLFRSGVMDDGRPCLPPQEPSGQTEDEESAARQTLCLSLKKRKAYFVAGAFGAVIVSWNDVGV